MFENRRYQGVIARAGRGRHTLTTRRILEVDLLIIGALIFVGIGIASLQSETGQTATTKRAEQKSARPKDETPAAPTTIGNTPKLLVTTLLRGDGIMVRTAVLEVALPNHILTRATTLVAARRVLDRAAASYGMDAPAPSAAARWVRTPHPLAVALPRRAERPVHRIVQTSFGLIATGGPADDRPGPLVRLDTRTGASPFWFLVAGLSFVTFASGFWNSRKAHRKKAISTLSV